MKKYIIANWKMQPQSLAEAEQILDSVDEYIGSLAETKEFSLVFCPPFVFLEEVGKILKTSHLLHQAELGAQDIATDDTTSLTGEVSGPMLGKLGVRYVIVGHSERRWKIAESDEVVNQKLKAVLRNEMTPIVCIGEKERNGEYKNFLKNQVAKTFEGLSADEIGRCLIAYEPVWAISTNPNAKPDSPESAIESIRLIQEALSFKFQVSSFRFLYGGSVTSKNINSFLDLPEFSGVLVGGASVNKDEFIKLLSALGSLASK